jgi:tripartite-type tricarboxylate transporter receptor subunit TctC
LNAPPASGAFFRPYDAPPTSLTSLPGCSELQHKAQRKSRAVWEDTMDRRQVLGAVGAFACAGAPLRNALAQNEPVEQFYKRRQLTIISYSPGVSENYARLLARHMGKHMPGEPNFIVSGMPGAGGMKAADYLNTVAPRDGTVICSIGPGVPFEPMLGRSPVKFDPFALSWIGSISTSTAIAMSWHTSKLRTLDDLLRDELVVPGTGAGADTQIVPAAMNNLVGTKFRIIPGYQNILQAALAMERGEVDGMGYWTLSSLQAAQPTWLPDKRVNVLFHTARKQPAALPGVPMIRERARNAVDAQALDFILARELISRLFVGPPGVPAERNKALRAAFMATMRDPDFLAEAAKMRLEIDPLSAEEVVDVLRKAAASPPEVLERVMKSA